MLQKDKLLSKPKQNTIVAETNNCKSMEKSTEKEDRRQIFNRGRLYLQRLPVITRRGYRRDSFYKGKFMMNLFQNAITSEREYTAARAIVSPSNTRHLSL